MSINFKKNICKNMIFYNNENDVQLQLTVQSLINNAGRKKKQMQFVCKLLCMVQEQKLRKSSHRSNLKSIVCLTRIYEPGWWHLWGKEIMMGKETKEIEML